MNEAKPENKIDYFKEDNIPNSEKDLIDRIETELEDNPNKDNDYYWMQRFITHANSLMLPINNAFRDFLLNDDQYSELDEQLKDLIIKITEISKSSAIPNDEKKTVLEISKENKEILMEMYMGIVNKFKDFLKLIK